ncbi:MAG: transcriptional repressor [Clostridiales bacterium]|nr:transcriptional repressor [Clostridiales bacterium]
MRREYNTRQKREMLKFLQDRRLQHFSVDEVVAEMQDRGEKIGRTTVYRFLELLTEQGNVRKYQNAQGITQYQHVEDVSSCDDHFHMMCKNCGNLIHVDCELMHSMAEHLFAAHGFMLDPRDTILKGLCEKCREGGEEAEDHGAHWHKECHHCV